MSDRIAAWGSDFRHLLIFACLAALFKETDGWSGLLEVAALGVFTSPAVASRVRRIFWAARLRLAVRRAKKGLPVILNSPGGTAREALEVETDGREVGNGGS